MNEFSWKTKSLRFWLTFGLLLAVMPLALAALGGHVLLNRGVIASFADVADRHRYELAPASRLGTELLEAVEPVDEFVADEDPTRLPTYRELREHIEAGFAELHGRLAGEPEPRTLVDRAREDWTAADRLATEILSVRRSPGDPRVEELMQRFHGSAGAAVDRLRAVAAALEADIAGDHDRALLFYERTEWVTGIATAVSFIAIVAAVITIGRVLSGSVDRLVAGAERFAAGDRAHRIDVQVPPELHAVAEEFNRMIVRIHESEAALAELARRDGLTKLLNRRAFDDRLLEVFAGLDRRGGSAALLIVDVDHFKRINDTRGHGAGDDVLRSVARTLSADVRLTDHVFRIGGEEFAVLLAGPDADAAAATAERLRQALAAETIPIKGGAIGVTASVGVATTRAGSSPAALVAAADAALYRAKAGGRNRVVVDGTPG